MTHTHQTPPHNEPHPPALTIRHKRRWLNGTGLSQRELARRVGLTARQLYRYEHRTKLPEPVRRLFLLAAALGVTADDLIQPDVLRALRSEVKAREAEAGPP